MIDLEAIAKRAESATPGPWEWHTYYQYDQTIQALEGEEPFLETTSGISKSNKEFISNSITDIPLLLECVRELKQFIGELGPSWLPEKVRERRQELLRKFEEENNV